MKGLLAVNHFLTGEKFTGLHTHLKNAAKKMNIALEIRTNLELACDTKPDVDFVLFWDKDVNLARRLELSGLPVFNSAGSIALCDDKARTYIELEGVVSQPPTMLSPKCYFESDMTAFVKVAAETLGLPLVFKECFGSFGQQVYLCKELDDIFSHITDKPFILQKHIKESRGRDKRLEIIGDRCVLAVARFNDNDFRSNVTNGGKMIKCIPTEQEIDTAVKACKRLGLTFGGVDILENGDVCEVNSNAHIINIMNACNTDIAPLIFEEIRRKTGNGL